jgi:hypothetical protein
MSPDEFADFQNIQKKNVNSYGVKNIACSNLIFENTDNCFAVSLLIH